MDTVVVNGFFVGLVYALVGVGLVVTYRCSRVLNFGYAGIGIVAAFLFSELYADNGVRLLPALAAAVALAALLGAGTEIVVIRPLRDRPRLTPTVGTLAVGTVLITYASRRWGVQPRYTPPLVMGEGVEVAGLNVTPQQLLILVVAVVLVVGLWALNRFTSLGLRLRATALDPYAAGLVGVNNNLTSMAAWGIAGALAGVSAILIAPTTTFDVNFMTGLVLRGLAAALIGGLTSIGGAFAAGIVLGMAEAWIAYETPVIGTVEVVLALFIILLLLIRPQGLVRSSY
jgi:branched-chain amino acid transport system permease protein